MEDKHSQQLLRDPKQSPSDELFQQILDNSIYELLNKMKECIESSGLDLEWRYYNDGKSWLGKVTFKKKTVVWLSVWEEFIKAGFYFTEKTRQGVMDLDFNENIKTSFTVAKPIGKLIPLIIEINDEVSLHDFTIILNYKKSL